MMTNFDINKWVRPNIRCLKPYSSARDEFTGTDKIFMDANENPFGDYNRYPDPYQQDIKEKLATIKSVDVDQLFLGNGSDEVIDLLFKMSCTPAKDKVLTFGPTYGMYQVTADIYNVELETIPLSEDFQLPWDHIEKLDLDDYKMIFICSPNNPSGNTVAGIERVLESTSTLVVVDEAYIDFSTKESCIKTLSKYNNIIVLQTLSKAFGLAGVRVGMGLSNPSVIEYLNKVKPPYNISIPNQNEVLNQLRSYDKIQRQIQLIVKEKKRVNNALKNSAIVKKVFPSDANFILFVVDNADKRYRDFLNDGVVVRNRNSQIPNALRVSIGTQEENKLFIEILNKLES